jgi:hypothetical protein
MWKSFERLLQRHRVAIILICAFLVAAPVVFAITQSLLLTIFWSFLVAAAVVFAGW